MCFPGPGSYKADFKHVEETARTARIHSLINADKGWRPVKSKAPDCGSYNFGLSKDKTGKKTVSHFFSRPGGDKDVKAEKTTFTTEYIKIKKFVPGSGSYKPKYDIVSTPYTRKRI